MQFKLQQVVSTAIAADSTARARLIAYLNKTITVPAFSAEYPEWAGASYVVAKGVITKDNDWSILMPVTRPNDTFVATIMWIDEDNNVNRYKLWTGIGELLNYPLYAGEIIPAGDAYLEIWNVEDELTASADESWTIPISTLELPESADDTTAETYTMDDLCITLSGSPSTIEDYLEQCPNNS